MPGRKKSAKTPPHVPKKKKAATEDDEKKDDFDDDVDYESSTGNAEMDKLAESICKSLSMKDFFFRCRRHGYPIVVWSWTDGGTGITYITVRVQLLGTTVRKDLDVSMEDEGRKLCVRVNFPDGGEDCNPEHLLLLNSESNVPFSRTHSMYTKLSEGRRAIMEAAASMKEDDHVEMIVKLPFQCNPNGFVDPLHCREEHQNKIRVGVFPLDKNKYPEKQGYPVPSAKFMHITMKELHEPVKPQQVGEEETHFS